MTVLLTLFDNQDPEAWRAALAAALPEDRVMFESEVSDPAAIDIAVIGPLPATSLDRFPNLSLIHLLSAGVDHLAGHLPEVPVARLADPGMSRSMAHYVTHWVIHYQRDFHQYRQDQSESRWRPQPTTEPADFAVGILGYGNIGRVIGDTIGALGFPLNVWSRTERDDVGVASFNGPDALDRFLAASSVVVNLLPATDETRNFFDAERFAAFTPGSFLINLGRGLTIDESALVDALDQGRLAGATLDVTETEPLPEASPLWSHPAVSITPHIAGDTMISTAPGVVAANITRVRRGEDPFPRFVPERGY